MKAFNKCQLNIRTSSREQRGGKQPRSRPKRATDVEMRPKADALQLETKKPKSEMQTRNEKLTEKIAPPRLGLVSTTLGLLETA